MLWVILALKRKSNQTKKKEEIEGTKKRPASLLSL